MDVTDFSEFSILFISCFDLYHNYITAPCEQGGQGVHDIKKVISGLIEHLSTEAWLVCCG